MRNTANISAQYPMKIYELNLTLFFLLVRSTTHGLTSSEIHAMKPPKHGAKKTESDSYENGFISEI